MRELAAFLAIAIVVIVTPGQDTALTIRNTLLGGRAAGVATAVGIVSGIACWTVAASAGLAALLVASEPVFVALRLAGAAYLVYLGLQALRHAIRPARDCDRPRRRLAARSSPRLPPGTAEQPRQPEDRRLLHQPPAAVRRAPSGACSRTGCCSARSGSSGCPRTRSPSPAPATCCGAPRIRRSLDALTGTVLVAFGIRLAADR